MISFKTYYDNHTGKMAQFSKNYNTRKAVELSDTFEGRVKLFKDYYFGWFINPLTKDLNERTALITVNLLFSLCDVLEQFRKGQKSTPATTGDYVKSVLKEIYADDLRTMNTSLADDYINQLYLVLRNGLHHDLTSRGIHIGISPAISTMYSTSDSGELEEIWFNPKYCLIGIKAKFTKYIQKLKNNTNSQLRADFDTMFQELFALEELNNYYDE